MPATLLHPPLKPEGAMALFVAREVAAEVNPSSGIATSVFNHSPPPVLIGGLIALFLSGVVFMQVAMYFQLYSTDRRRTKGLVSVANVFSMTAVVLDVLHSSMVITANWEDLVMNYGAYAELNSIAWSIAVGVSAITTFIVHGFFIHRIYALSKGNLYITTPLITLALLRVVTTSEMIKLGNYPLFVSKFSWVFTLGLAVSASLDVLIAAIMCYYIRKGRSTAFVRMSRIIDILTLYAVENGMITCVATALSLFFWLFMRYNFVFLGMHLAINKLYANSFLASLNARKSLANKSQGSGQVMEAYALPLRFPSINQTRDNSRQGGQPQHTNSKIVEITIDVERTVQRDSDVDGRASDQDSHPVESEKRAMSDMTGARMH
ncbi:hypothetical protein C2E23DRAFT_866466 [Lenzites betulinus]|nr:hypothetical protein C2E23DRAFT_866466 [Lenzites betulinus]